MRIRLSIAISAIGLAWSLQGCGGENGETEVKPTRPPTDVQHKLGPQPSTDLRESKPKEEVPVSRSRIQSGEAPDAATVQADKQKKVDARRVAALIQKLKELKDKDPRVSTNAAGDLSRIGPAAVPALTEALKDEDHNVRQGAIVALGSIGPTAKDVPALIRALKDEDAQVRDIAAGALAGIGPAAVSALAQALKDEDRFVRGRAAYALGRIGPAAKDAVPALTEALKDKSIPDYLQHVLDQIKKQD